MMVTLVKVLGGGGDMMITTIVKIVVMMVTMIAKVHGGFHDGVDENGGDFNDTNDYYDVFIVMIVLGSGGEKKNRFDNEVENN